LKSLIITMVFCFLFCSNCLAEFESVLIPENSHWGDYFGNSVDISGNFAVIGAVVKSIPGDEVHQGAVHVFERINDHWEETPQIIVDRGDLYNFLGNSVSIEGENFVSGDCATLGYVFERTEEGWVVEEYLEPDGAHYHWRVGHSVSVNDNRIIIGAPSYFENRDFRPGTAFIYTRTDEGWQNTAILLADDGEHMDGFGKVVEISGDYAVIGTYGGHTYVFKCENDEWTQVAKLSDAGRSDEGPTIAICEDEILVGDMGGDAQDIGRIYLYRQVDNEWTLSDTLTPRNPNGGYFGSSLAYDDGKLIVGAIGDATHGERSGAAYVFQRADGEWQETGKLFPAEGRPWDNFGASVGIYQNQVICGAPAWSTQDREEGGVVYIYDLNEMESVHDETSNMIGCFTLLPAYPNPFNSTTTIEFALPFASEVTLNLYNLSGHRVETLVNGRMQAGVHRTMLDAGDMASGLYFVKLEGVEQSFTQKIMLVK
jgi:hypothetical protein